MKKVTKTTKAVQTEKIVLPQIVEYKTVQGAMKALATSLVKTDDIIFYILDNIATGNYKLSEALGEAVQYRNDKNYRSVYSVFDSLVKALRLANKCFIKKHEETLNAFKKGNIGAVYNELKSLKKIIDASVTPKTLKTLEDLQDASVTPESPEVIKNASESPESPEAIKTSKQIRPTLEEIEKLLKNVKTYKLEIMDLNSLLKLKELLEELN